MTTNLFQSQSSTLHNLKRSPLTEGKSILKLGGSLMKDRNTAEVAAVPFRLVLVKLGVD